MVLVLRDARAVDADDVGRALRDHGASVVEELVDAASAALPGRWSTWATASPRRSPDAVLSIPAPGVVDVESAAARFPDARFCEPTSVVLSDPDSTWSRVRAAAERWRVLASLSPAEPPALLFRSARHGVLAASRTSPGWGRRFSALIRASGPIDVLGFDLGHVSAKHVQVARAFVCLEVAEGRVHVLPRIELHAVPLLATDATSADVLARASARRTHRSLLGAVRRVATSEAPGDVAVAAVEAADSLLDLPALTAVPASHQLCPVLAVDVVPSTATGDGRAVVADVRWVTVGGRDAEHVDHVEAWLRIARGRRVHRARRLLVLPGHADGTAAGHPADAAAPPTPPDPTIVHPLAALLPRLAGERGVIATRPVDDACFETLHDGLTGPEGVTGASALLAHLARVTDDGLPAAGGAVRYVEPGVGRTYLVDGVRVAGRPELEDFAVTGAGLTPYSSGGYVSVGTPITGRAALLRLHHRRRCAERLEQLGVRTAPVVAVVRLPGRMAPLPDGSATEAGIAVRGFRCVLRVRQLDPVAVYYQSLQHAPVVGEAVLEVARACGIPTTANVGALLQALDRYAGGFDDIRRVLGTPPSSDRATDEALALRRWLIARYAPLLLELARRRLARELGRDPAERPVETTEYLGWFAAAVGRQLALWRTHRFLHDYHKPGVERSNGLMTLVESNVTLLAEFPDLDTAIFVDDDEDADALQLHQRDRALLRAAFDDFHGRELEAARAVVASLALAATACDTASSRWCDAVLLASYAAPEGSACPSR